MLVVAACRGAAPGGAPIANTSASTTPTGCSRKAIAPSPGPLQPPQAIVDVDDRCPALPVECMAGFDYQDLDGCPDPPHPEIVFAMDSAVVPRAADAVLDQVANDARQLATGVRLIVIGDAWPREPAGLARARADAVVEALVDRCVAPAIVGASDHDVPGSYEGRDPPPNRAVIVARGCK